MFVLFLASHLLPEAACENLCQIFKLGSAKKKSLSNLENPVYSLIPSLLFLLICLVLKKVTAFPLHLYDCFQYAEVSDPHIFGYNSTCFWMYFFSNFYWTKSLAPQCIFSLQGNFFLKKLTTISLPLSDFSKIKFCTCWSWQL